MFRNSTYGGALRGGFQQPVKASNAWGRRNAMRVDSAAKLSCFRSLKLISAHAGHIVPHVCVMFDLTRKHVAAFNN